MKLNKKNLLHFLRNDLEDLGYLFFKDGVTGSDGLFVKPVLENKFLTLGLIISNQYNYRYSASYYLSRVTRWGSLWGDIPLSSYRRIGAFLTFDERKVVLNDDSLGENVVDVWWEFSPEKGFSSFLNTVKLTENRLLQQLSLIGEIDSSIEIDEMYIDASSTIEYIDIRSRDRLASTVHSGSFSDEVPSDFFVAAESVLKLKGPIKNYNQVKQLAADSWRIFVVKQKYTGPSIK